MGLPPELRIQIYDILSIIDPHAKHELAWRGAFQCPLIVNTMQVCRAMRYEVLEYIYSDRYYFVPLAHASMQRCLKDLRAVDAFALQCMRGMEFYCFRHHCLNPPERQRNPVYNPEKITIDLKTEPSTIIITGQTECCEVKTREDEKRDMVMQAFANNTPGREADFNGLLLHFIEEVGSIMKWGDDYDRLVAAQYPRSQDEWHPLQ